jgi:multisubunit Na+/H+ antiporter MnhB subunit
MTESVLLKSVARILCPALIAASLWIFWRGHHLPGGGFIGGLVAVCAFSVALYAWGLKRVGPPIAPAVVMAMGLGIALVASVIPLFVGKVFFQAVWVSLPLIGEIGTPVLFDFGVYCVVVGMGSNVLLMLAEEQDHESKKKERQ